MERSEFTNLAPEYYMLALYIYFEYPRSYYTERGFVADFTITTEDHDEHCYVENEALRKEALRLLIKHDAITILPDPFGPTLWRKGEGYDRLEEALESSPASVFYKARVSGDRRFWLTSALLNLNRAAHELRITSDDFSEVHLDEWTPISISQSDTVVAHAVKELETATSAIEQDNGYAVTHAQERDQVVHDLKGGLEKLKSDAVSLGWIRRTLGALKIASGRFASTAKAQAIDGALLALKEFIKKHMSTALEHLWSLLP